MNLILSIFVLAIPTQSPPSSIPAAPNLAAFEKLVSAYSKLHKQAESDTSSMKPTPTRSKITAQREDLAGRIVALRQNAQQGAIFTPVIAVELRSLLKEAMSGAGAARVAKSLNRSEPRKFGLRVNAEFPSGLPLQTTPATILGGLPKLPAELEYRIVGRSLVLRDVRANLIVDFLQEAIP